MADQQQQQQRFCLRWNDFQSNAVASFKELRNQRSFTDVTIACEGQTCKAHKMVLSACSPYFKELLQSNPSKHPIIILQDVSFSHIQCILEYMYSGSVNVSQTELNDFLKTAERLQVKGLAGGTANNDNNAGPGSAGKNKREKKASAAAATAGPSGTG